MNNIWTIDLTRALPPRLKQDETMLALANVIAAELQKNAVDSRLATIYARIDELDESILDILAYDLHVDWYSYSDPVNAKRAVIKSSVKVHKRLGTKFAIETALGALHPGTYIEEWFQYGGDPHYFRVVLDVTRSRVAASYSRLAKEINFYKRLTSKLESLVYQTTVIIETSAEGRAFPHRAGLTGLYNAGTEPQRAVVGALGADGVMVDLEAGGFDYRARAAGTEPQRAVIGTLAGDKIGAFIDGVNFPYAAGMTGKYNAGEEPQRADAAGVETSNIVQTVTAEGYGYTAKYCGTSRCK